MATDDEPDRREPILARRSPFSPATKLCPKCLTPLTPRNKDLWGIVPAEYYCQKCSYSGSVYLEDSAKGDR